MSNLSHTSRPAPVPPPPPSPTPTTTQEKSQETLPISDIVRKTVESAQAQIRNVDIIHAALNLLCGTALILWGAAILDHQLTTGVGRLGRLGIFATLLAFWGWIAWKSILPYFLFRIHPFYAARVIEEHHPRLKNNLLNLLFFTKTDPSDVKNHSQVVLKSLSYQTTLQLAHITDEETIDYTPMLRKIAILCVLCVGFALYGVFSPKSTISSAARILFPWSQTAAPTRVIISQIDPNDCVIYQNQSVEINARIENLRENERAEVLYSTADELILDEPIVLRESGQNLYSCRIAPAGGIQQNSTWRIEAGDASSRVFRIEVLPPLDIQVEKIVVTPPVYLDIPPFEQNSGDLKIYEGSEVLLLARANETIRHAELSARSLQTGARENFTLKKISNDTVQLQFSLPRSNSNLTTDVWKYTLRFQNPVGVWSENPLERQIEVLSDEAPLLKILDAPEDGAETDAKGEATIEFEAHDPDFGLRGVAFRAFWNGQPLEIPAIMNILETQNPLKTPLHRVWKFRASDYRLKGGDEIVWYLEAADSKRPQPNRVATPPRTLRIPGGYLSEDDVPRPMEGETPSNIAPDVAAPGAALSNNPQQNPQQNASQNAQPGSDSGSDPDAAHEDSSEATDAPQPSQETPQDTSSEGKSGAQGEKNEGEKNKGGSESEQDAGGESGSDAGSDSSVPKLAKPDFDPLAPNEGEKNDEKKGENERESSSETDSKDDTKGGSKSKPKGEEKGEDANDGVGEGTSEKPQGENTEKPKSGAKKSDESGAESGSNKSDSAKSDSSDAQSSQGGSEGERSDAPPQAPASGSDSEEGGMDSTEETPPAAEQKETSDGSGLRESDGRSPNRESIMDDGSDDGAGESSAMQGAQDDQGGAESGENSSPTHPQTQPGEAIEQLLKHREKTQSQASDDPANQNSPRSSDAEGSASSEASESSAEGEPIDLNDGAGGESPGKTSEQKGEEKGQSSTRSGSQNSSGKQNDSSSNFKPDQSTDGGSSDDRHQGGNRSGADEQSNQQGTGRDGSNTPDTHGDPTGSGGDGPTGSRGGNSQLADRPTGVNDPNQHSGAGSSTKPAESGRQGTGHSSSRSGSSHQRGASGMGHEASQESGADGNFDTPASADRANVEFAQKQTILALEHLRDILDRDDDALLRELGWTREEAEAFWREWHKLHADIERSDATPEEKRRAEQRFSGLGLTPRSLRYGQDASGARSRPTIRNARQYAPPEAWREHFDAYTRSVGAESP
ncbi:MAG: hypothetical protein Q4D38_01610 [Planctomycetia bacterium]|nr:hypothetical protein [Planctomycetia bacterium]